MPKDQKLEVFPFIPDSGIKTVFHQFEDQDIMSIDDVNKILVFMFNHQEREYYYYVRQNHPINIHLKGAMDDDWLLADEFVNFNYRHPEYPSTFINIKGEQLKPTEAAILGDNPIVYTRFTLKITEKCKRKFRIDQLLYTQSRQNENPLELKPNFMGFGIDLLKLPKWILSLFR